MKNIVYLFLFIPFWTFAQNRQVVEAVSGEDISKKVSTQFQFLFPEFTDGEVLFYGLPKSSGKLNYNMLIGEMQFVNNNEILALANFNNVAYVKIENRKFFPFKNNEFVEELMLTPRCQLMVRYAGKVAPHSKKVAYGGSSSTSSVTSYSSIGSNNRQHDISVVENVLVTVDYFYYLLGTNGKYTIVRNVKAFTKMFPEHKTKIETYVKEHKIRFNSKEELKSLLEYCTNLT